jgi:hypothetical protein
MQETAYYIQGAENLPEVQKIGSKKLIEALKQELQASGVTADVDWKPNPQSTKTDRELVLTILAIGAGSVLIASAVKKVIDALNGRPIVISESELTPALDGSGKPIRNSAGDPVMTEKKTSHVQAGTQASDSVGIKVLKVFEMSSATGKAAENQAAPKPTHPDKDKSSS